MTDQDKLIARMKATAKKRVEYSTHWEGCEAEHVSCAVLWLIAKLEEKAKEGAKP